MEKILFYDILKAGQMFLGASNSKAVTQGGNIRPVSLDGRSSEAPFRSGGVFLFLVIN